jgi:hypothetical protein
MRFIALAFAAAISACSSPGTPGSPDASGTASRAGLDVAVSSVQVPATAAPGQTIDVRFTLRNLGSGYLVGAVTTAIGHEDVAPEVYYINPGWTYDFFLDGGETLDDTLSVTIPSSFAAGNYRVRMTTYLYSGADENPANDVGVTPITLSGGACTHDAFEPDNTMAAARPIADGVYQQRNFCFDPVDWVRLELIAGVVYELHTTHGYLKIVNAEGTELRYPEMVLFGLTDWREKIQPARSGTYFAAVLPASPDGQGSDTEYVLRFGVGRPDLLVDDYNWSGEYSFAVPAGGIVRFDVPIRNEGQATAGAHDVAAAIAGTTIASASMPPLAATGSASATVVGTIPATIAPGTYPVTAWVDPGNVVAEWVEENNTANSAPWWTLTVTAPACPPDAFEEDDHPAAAHSVAEGVELIGNHCEDVHDWWSFTAEAGETYVLTVLPQGTSSSASPVANLYDTDATSLLATSVGFRTVDFRSASKLVWTAPATGTYFVDVTPFGLYPEYGTNRTYSLRLERGRPDLSAAAPLLQDGYTTRFPGSNVHLSWDYVNAGDVPAPASQIGFYLSTDSVVTGGDRLIALLPMPPLSASSMSRESALIALPADLPPGTYWPGLLVDPANSVAERDETNNTIAWATVSVAAAPCALDAFEHDDTPDDAHEIALGASQSRNQCDDASDWVSFSGTQGDQLLVEIQSTSFSVNDRIEVYEPGATSPLADNDSGIDPRVFWVPPRTASYLIRLGDNALEVGASYDPLPYTVRIAVCPNDAYEPDDTFAQATPIVVGAAAQSHNMCSGGDDLYAFVATGGVQYRIETRRTGANIDTDFHLFDASGGFLGSASNGTGGVDERLTWTAPASGTYYIKVFPELSKWGFDSGYTITVQ